MLASKVASIRSLVEPARAARYVEVEVNVIFTDSKALVFGEVALGGEQANMTCNSVTCYS